MGASLSAAFGARNGHHELVYENGDTYLGEFKDGKRHGRGIYMSTKGHRYEGNWSNDMRNVTSHSFVHDIFLTFGIREKVPCFSPMETRRIQNGSVRMMVSGETISSMVRGALSLLCLLVECVRDLSQVKAYLRTKTATSTRAPTKTVSSRALASIHIR